MIVPSLSSGTYLKVRQNTEENAFLEGTGEFLGTQQNHRTISQAVITPWGTSSNLFWHQKFWCPEFFCKQEP